MADMSILKSCHAMDSPSQVPVRLWKINSLSIVQIPKTDSGIKSVPIPSMLRCMYAYNHHMTDNL